MVRRGAHEKTIKNYWAGADGVAGPDHDCADLVQQNEKILVSRSLSKSYGLAGLRFGYLAAQPIDMTTITVPQ